VIVGRGPELAAVAAVLDSARGGRSAALCLEGEPGIGKTTLLDAAEGTAPDFLRVRTTGVTTDLELGHAALLDVLLPLREHLGAVPAPQRDALSSALGWSGGAAPGDRYLVAAGTLALLAAAAEERPVLVVVDDVQWVDRESRVALAFAARRLAHDRVAVLLARRTGPDTDDLAGLPRLRLGGLAAVDAAVLLGGRVAAALVDPLVAATGGNPLALGEAVRQLTAEQRRGSAPLPDVLPVGDRVTAAFERSLQGLSGPARRALVLAAASWEPEAGPVVAALRAAGMDPDTSVEEAERSGALTVEAGSLAFAHPLLRAAVWQAATPAERRSAHAALARAVVDHPDREVRHRAQAATGHDADLATRLEELAAQERVRRGYAAASVLQERAARLHPSALRAAGARAAAVEDALLSGDVRRVRAVGAEVLGGPADAPTRARVLLGLGVLEEYAGSLPQARELLTAAAALGEGSVRLRALAELATVGYRLGSLEAMVAAADALQAGADSADPEHEMLACLCRGAALAFSGRWDEAYAPSLRALELLESAPALNEPRHLVWGVAASWAGELERGLASVDRRLDTARALGALGVLPLALSLIAGAVMLLGRHQDGYALAGEAVELGTELGYVADVAIAYELLAWQQAARGLHAEAEASLAESRRLSEVAGVSAVAVHVHLVDAFAALCRGDLERVVVVLERRLAADGGRLPRGDYPLGVAPDLVEAYLGLGRRDEAVALATRHAELHRDSPEPEPGAHAARLAGLLAVDEAAADAAFAAAYEAHRDPYEAARTRLLHGSRLRRAGRRVEARQQLRAAADDFAALGLDGWAARAREELAATGQTARRGPQEGDQLTSQETRVALLVARGMANREIAAALFLSPRTVEHHVASVLRKRSLRSRTELAAAFTAAPPGARV
jgi:DNA-binding CsgD family transcriptional regulator